ncbi:MAG: RNA polymerase factor sigma-54 [Gammaproteobacteria bacterium]|jgi:RNA polymerase sigma-54 factor|nr:RNA polymerase factor sigma-54 [Gammaproteobacteria bacterium]MDG2339267.1 RNA polymerase factor sigma-54 [Gammaproteobacteria bacterium]
MKLSLQLKLGQQLTMTPQLQQAIRLLQLSTLDLQQEIHQALESNPMLELIENSEDDTPDTNDNSTTTDLNEPPAAEDKASTRDNAELNSTDSDWQNEIPNDLGVDTHWDDIYPGTSSQSNSFDGDSSDFESRTSAEGTLQDHLLWQLNLTHISEKDNSIALAIIDAIDNNGMLTVDLDSIHSGFDEESEVELDELVAVLHRVQQFDPIGVGHRDLTECLMLQLAQIESPELEKAVRNAKLVISEHIDLLGNRDYAHLMRRTKLKESELSEAITIIESLNPRPGASICPPSTSYVVPDVIVSKDNSSGKWKVELNPETAPKIRINSSYAALVKRADTSDDNNYLRDNLQEAKWFIKSLQSRNETLMKVSTRIVEHQRGFLEYGEEAMKPLVLHDIAEAVSMHESTISRVTTQKYMHTPRGIFELKYFFSSHVSTKGGGECSSTAIRAIIRKLVAAENTKKPLSDSKITNLLEEKGINVARRTIAKYRESLSIPPSNERKRLAG